MSGGRGPSVLVTGTPGVGKTTACRALAALLGARCLTVGDLLAPSPYVRWVAELQTYDVVDPEGARRLLESHIEGGEVVDTHAVELVPDAPHVFVLRKAPDVLYRELLRRRWPLRKVLDNVWAEMLDLVATAAKARWPHSVQLDVTHRRPQETVEAMARCLKASCRDEEVDWLSYSEATGFLDLIEGLSRWRRWASPPWPPGPP